MADIDSWLTQTLWTRWGWQGYVEDDCDVAYRDAAERGRIESAVRFVLRAMGNNKSPETQAVVDAIVQRRERPSA